MCLLRAVTVSLPRRKSLHACVWLKGIYAWFVCSVSGRQSRSRAFWGFHILTFKQIFGGDQKKKKEEGRITWGEKEGKKERERDREGLEPRAVLLLASSQRFFCETRGPGEQGQSALNFRLQVQRYRIHRNQVFSKGSFIRQ